MTNKRAFYLLFQLLFSPTLFCSPITLNEAYSSAIKKNEGPAIAYSATVQADEKVSQAGGALLPQLALIGGYTRQDNSTTSTSSVTSLLKPDQYSARLNFTQPLFRGLSEYAAWRSVKAKLRSQKAAETVAKINLYSRTAQAFFGVLSAAQDLKDLEILMGLTSKRVADIKERTKIGRSRKGELLSAQAQTASLKAQVEAADMQLQQAKENFKFVTGLETTTLLSDTTEKLLKISTSVEHYLDFIEKRPDIESLREDVNSADENVGVAKGAHLPTIDLVGNYYLHRTGILSDSKWDAGVTLSFPLFQGGVIQSQVRESIEVRKSKELLLSEARRNADREIRTYYQNYKSSVIQYEALEESLTLAEANYKEQNRDYRYGLVTNLEVLSALNAFQEAKRSFDRTYYQGKIAFVSLSASIGKLPEQKE